MIIELLLFIQKQWNELENSRSNKYKNIQRILEMLIVNFKLEKWLNRTLDKYNSKPSFTQLYTIYQYSWGGYINKP